MTVMLYKAPGPHKLHGVDVDYLIVDEDDVKAKLKEGWCKSPMEADAASKPKRGRPKKVEE